MDNLFVIGTRVILVCTVEPKLPQIQFDGVKTKKRKKESNRLTNKSNMTHKL